MNTPVPDSDLPVLYSFRRCPYAMRARMAIHYAGVPVALREVVLRDMPADLLAASPKGTVPVLVLPGGRVIDESLDIMRWALQQHDPDHWLGEHDRDLHDAAALIELNDGDFKHWLDRYKYADRYPDHPAAYYRDQARAFLAKLDALLRVSPYLVTDTVSIADIAIFPFIRQFAHVDRAWFDRSGYRALRAWLDRWLASSDFHAVMKKYPAWKPGDPLTVFPDPAVPAGR